MNDFFGEESTIMHDPDHIEEDQDIANE